MRGTSGLLALAFTIGVGGCVSAPLASRPSPPAVTEPSEPSRQTQGIATATLTALDLVRDPQLSIVMEDPTSLGYLKPIATPLPTEYQFIEYFKARPGGGYDYVQGEGQATHFFYHTATIARDLLDRIEVLRGNVPATRKLVDPVSNEGVFSFPSGTTGDLTFKIKPGGDNDLVFLGAMGDEGGSYYYVASDSSRTPEYMLETSTVRAATASLQVKVVDQNGKALKGLTKDHLEISGEATGRLSSRSFNQIADLSEGAEGSYLLRAPLWLSDESTHSFSVTVKVKNKPLILDHSY